MDYNFLYDNIEVPIIVCELKDDLEVIYQNLSAISIFNPASVHVKSTIRTLRELLGLSKKEYDTIFSTILGDKKIPRCRLQVKTYGNDPLDVMMSAVERIVDGKIFVHFYFSIMINETLKNIIHTHVMELIEIVYTSISAESAIRRILKFIGNLLSLSRTYVVESNQDNTHSNTYEWCAEGIESYKKNLQNLDNETYSFNDIIERGIAIFDNFSSQEQEILTAQGIKSIVFAPFTTRNNVFGYFGVDDCLNFRQWGISEIEIIKTTSYIISALLPRRDMELNITHSYNILNTVTNNVDYFVYVVDIETMELLFINEAFAATRGKQARDFIGKPCRELMKIGENRYACDLCPKKFMLDKKNHILATKRNWEFYDKNNDSWHDINANIVSWINGRDVFIITAKDITYRKKVEFKLKEEAQIDRLTGVFNRSYGQELAENILANVTRKTTFIFFDLDNLK